MNSTGELGGDEGCTARLTFRPVVDPGTSCQVGMPFHATATGFPPIKYVEGNLGAVGTNPVILYGDDWNVVRSEQAQFLTDVRMIRTAIRLRVSPARTGATPLSCSPTSPSRGAPDGRIVTPAGVPSGCADHLAESV